MNIQLKLNVDDTGGMEETLSNDNEGTKTTEFNVRSTIERTQNTR